MATGVSVRDAVREVLRAKGLTTIFGNPGSTEMRFFADWPKDFRYVMALQEASVVAMADGFAQATGGAAFVNLHSAAGLGNALGNVYTAYRNQTPLIIMAGQQSRTMFQTEPFLFADAAATFPQPYVKWSSEPARAAEVPAALARAYHLATQPPRGPVFLSVPADDWDEAAEVPALREVKGNVVPEPGALRGLADAIEASSRPALVAGPAIDRDGAWEMMVALAEKTKAAVWASPRAHRASFPEDHPYFAGFLPFDRRGVNEAFTGYDLVLVVGAPVFTYHVHNGGAYLPECCTLFHLTDDPDQAARAVAGISLIGSVPASLAALLNILPPTDRPDPEGRVLPPAPPRVPDSAALTAERVMGVLREHLPKDAVLVEEAPSHRKALRTYLPIRRQQSFYTGASGGLGWALPAAVGIALAQPERPVVCLIGDGSSMYSPQALWNAAQLELPITFIVMNNRSYGAMNGYRQLLGASNTPSFALPGLDLTALARGYGCQAQCVKTSAELQILLGTETRGPRLLDIQLAEQEPEFA